MYKLLNFIIPEKLRSTQEHNETYSADCDVPGVYVPNMSEEDNRRWKCKYIAGKNERVEIRRFMGGANIVAIVFKCGDVTLSANSKMILAGNEYNELILIIKEAMDYMNELEELKWKKI